MQWGFFLYHELAHVADIRLDHALTREFQRATLGEAGVGSEQTAGGFWLDEFARDEPGEAMADAFALWVMLYHTNDPQPVFWRKPEDADYKKIAQVMETALQRAAECRWWRLARFWPQDGSLLGLQNHVQWQVWGLKMKPIRTLLLLVVLACQLLACDRATERDQPRSTAPIQAAGANTFRAIEVTPYYDRSLGFYDMIAPIYEPDFLPAAEA
jgi:hypothetical protein